MGLINVVPWIFEVLNQADLVELHAIVGHWVKQAQEHDPAHYHSVIKTLVQVYTVDI